MLNIIRITSMCLLFAGIYWLAESHPKIVVPYSILIAAIGICDTIKDFHRKERGDE